MSEEMLRGSGPAWEVATSLKPEDTPDEVVEQVLEQMATQGLLTALFGALGAVNMVRTGGERALADKLLAGYLAGIKRASSNTIDMAHNLILRKGGEE